MRVKLQDYDEDVSYIFPEIAVNAYGFPYLLPEYQ